MKELFYKYQKSLLNLTNDPFCRKLLGINHNLKIDALVPNGYGFRLGKNKWNFTFRTYPVYQKRIGLALQTYDSLLEGIKYYFKPRQVQEFVTMYATTGNIFSGSGDGDWTGGSSPNWDTEHDSVSETANIVSATASFQTHLAGGGDYRIVRAYFPWDISAIPGGATSSAGTIDLYVTNINEVNGPDDSGFCEATPVTPGTIVDADFNNMTVDSPTEFVTRILVGSLSASQYNQYTINASGLSNIDSHIGGTFWEVSYRSGRDMDDVAPAPGTTIATVTVSTSDEGGTSQDPKLNITYSIGADAFLALL